MKQIDVYGTLGPACQSETMIEEMFRLGMTGMRLNLSHTGIQESSGWLGRFHGGAKRSGVEPKLLIDLQGPELRIGDMLPCELVEGETVLLGESGIPVPMQAVDSMEPGQRILLDDGRILLEAESVGEGAAKNARCRILHGGKLKPKKSIALPGLALELPTLTQSDKENIACAGEFGVTGVMLPFVRSKKDLLDLRRELKRAGSGQVEIYAKIENMAGVERLDEFLPLADWIVIARGDLGNAMPLWQLPGVQHRIGEACKAAGKPYMVVTQMLASMEHSPVPTRAEVSDIFYAVWHGASAVMLTGETAAGQYPLEAMEYMCRTVQSV